MPLMFRPLMRYADFRGRSTRSEFWLFYLLLFAVTGIFVTTGVVVDRTTGVSGSTIAFGVMNVVYLATMVPWFALVARRLHDVDKSGLWILAALIPGGVLVLLMFWTRDGTPGDNRFGPDPKGRLAPS